MADYIYLLENRLSPAQRSALLAVREVARSKALTVFLVGGAVRDLTTGSPVRDLDVAVQGNALKLKRDLEKIGAVMTGESEAGQALFAKFPGNVRMEIGSTLSVTFPKPGKPVVRPASILEDLRRRDFTANAMALSLNEGSYGLLMDPVNGVADIENRELRLVSNYGFIEDPVRMIRAARLMARLGWTLDEKTQTRYDTGKTEGYIAVLSEFHRGYETEEIFHEEDPLRVLKRLEAEGWMQSLAPAWNSTKVNVAELERLREVQTQLQMQGIQPDTAAANFPLLVAKLTAKEVEGLTASFPRPGFVLDIKALEGEAKELAALLGGKGAALPSQTWKLLTSAKPEAVLWVAYSTRSPALQAKFKSFYTEWPAARQKMPYTLMQEMRIHAEIEGYESLLEKLFFELMDGKLTTSEEMKAFLEPYSPPAPPPPVSLRRTRVAKKDAKPSKARAKKGAAPSNEAPEVEADVAIPEPPSPASSAIPPVQVPTPVDPPAKENRRPTAKSAQKPITTIVPEAEAPSASAETGKKTVSKSELGKASDTKMPAPAKAAQQPAASVKSAPPAKVSSKGAAKPVEAESPLRAGTPAAKKPSPQATLAKAPSTDKGSSSPVKSKSVPPAAKEAVAAPAKRVPAAKKRVR